MTPARDPKLLFFKDPRGSQEAPRGTQEARGVLKENRAKTYVFFHRKWIHRPFRVAFEGVTLTISAACHEKWTDAEGEST